MTPHPSHRAAPSRRVSTRARFRIVAATLAVLVAALSGPSAYADKGSTFGHDATHHANSVAHPHQQPQAPGQKGDPKGPDQAGQGDDTAADQEETLVTEPVTVETSLFLKATAQPITAYEMPFPCGEVWSGSTRSSHSPSVRSVDFNRPADLGAPVLAAAAGIVTTAVTGRNKPSYGQHVIVNHGNDESTMYAHLDSVAVVVGQEVEQGELLGTVGNTGNSFGSHLHFEERSGTNVVDAWFHGSRAKMPFTQSSQNCDEIPVSAYIPLAGDIVGEKPAELMFFEPMTPATFLIKRPGRSDKPLPFGTSADLPLVGDWDGNGRVNPGVRTPATKVFSLRSRGKVDTVKFGKKGDLPVAGNWDGTGAWEIGVRRKNKFVLRAAAGDVTKVVLGDANDLPVTGDWDGDGVTDLGVYDQASTTFTLIWTDSLGAKFTSTVVFGAPTDVPVTGDWDGDGITELGVWNGESQTFSPRLGQTVTAGRAKVSHTRLTGRIAD
jgi:hypothetical protein